MRREILECVGGPLDGRKVSLPHGDRLHWCLPDGTQHTYLVEVAHDDGAMLMYVGVTKEGNRPSE